MLKEPGNCPHPKMYGSGAWDSAAPSSITADECCAFMKAKRDKWKKMAVKLWGKKEDGFGFVFVFFFSFFFCHTSIFCSFCCNKLWMSHGSCRGWMDQAMKHNDAGWEGTGCGDAVADLWGLLHSMKTSAWGGKGLCKNLSVCNLSHYHSPSTVFLHADL